MADAKKTSFSATCSRLSQYLKENRRPSFVDLGGLLVKPAQEPIITTAGESTLCWRPPTTLNLLAGLEAQAESRTDAAVVSDRNATEEREPEKAPLTIFFCGKLMVFENFSPETADDVMSFARNSVPAVRINACDISMPIAKRASLQRFIQKRKDRIISKAPYQINGSFHVGPTAKSQDSKSWLGLGQEIANLNKF